MFRPSIVLAHEIQDMGLFPIINTLLPPQNSESVILNWHPAFDNPVPFKKEGVDKKSKPPQIKQELSEFTAIALATVRIDTAGNVYRVIEKYYLNDGSKF